MQQIKLFKGVDSDLVELEKTVNRWIRKTGVEVLSVEGNLTAAPAASTGGMNTFAAGDVLILVRYNYEPSEDKT